MNKKLVFPIGMLGIVALAFGAYVFQPWKLFVDTEVQETIPSAQPAPAETLEVEESDSAAIESSEAAVEPSVPDTKADAVKTEPLILAQGSLISHEYATSGTVKILQLADGTRILRLENLDTSDGPKVEVWLTDAPVLEGRDGWFVFDDGNHRSLGALKGNQGNQNYEIPAELDLADFSSVSLWCVTFSVSFGAAELTASR